MQFPGFGESPSAGVDLVHAYVAHVGQHEPDNRDAIDDLPPTDPFRASMMIARGCIVALDGNEQAADRIFRRANRDLTTVQTNGGRFGPLGSAALRLSNIATMLEQRHNPESIATARRELHGLAIADLGHAYHVLKTANSDEERRIAKGDLTDTLALGSLTRYRHPWLLAMPALLHHDQGVLKCNNIDMLVIDRGPYTVEPTVRQTQMKHECIDLCGEVPSYIKYPSEFHKDPRDLYTEKIILISGCCDLGVPKNGRWKETPNLADRLIWEYKGTADPHSIKKLDVKSDELTLAITMDDPRRRGRQRARPLQPYKPWTPPTKLATVSTLTPKLRRQQTPATGIRRLGRAA